MNESKKRITILGSTGSIGTQALEVISENSSLFEVYALTANNRVGLLIEQARRYHPEVVVIANEKHYPLLKESLSGLPIKVFAGEDALSQTAAMDAPDIVLTAMVGYSGVKPTIEAVKAGKRIALANKETLVAAGGLICGLVEKHKASIIPVDSEHSAIFQCLAGEGDNSIEKVILTASGGPFRSKTMEQLRRATKAEALNHPNWDMGAKITIDSATMMNKGFEVIEAKWLFGVSPAQIEVVVHPQSIVHSLVQFTDGSIKAQMGLPDMKLPIQYAFTYPERLQSRFPRFDFSNYPSLTFEKPDTDRFRSLAFAYYAMERGGNMPCILNAANEIVVEAFLQDKIGFMEMSDVIEKVMLKAHFIDKPVYEDYIQTDKAVRQMTLLQVQQRPSLLQPSSTPCSENS